MPNVVLDMAMSLDGFIAGTNDEDHGLHNYFFSPSGPTREVIEEGFKTTGTIIMGRRSYEVGAARRFWLVLANNYNRARGQVQDEENALSAKLLLVISMLTSLK